MLPIVLGLLLLLALGVGAWLGFGRSSRAPETAVSSRSAVAAPSTNPPSAPSVPAPAPAPTSASSPAPEPAPEPAPAIVPPTVPPATSTSQPPQTTEAIEIAPSAAPPPPVVPAPKAAAPLSAPRTRRIEAPPVSTVEPRAVDKPAGPRPVSTSVKPGSKRKSLAPEDFEVESPQPISIPAPAYPEAARGTGGGTPHAKVTVRILVDAKGGVKEATVGKAVVDGGGPAAPFEQAALAAARQGRFQPGQRRGEPVEMEWEMTFEFGIPPGKP